MSENKNIDRLFQESFKDFEVDAPQGTWDNIEKRLTQKHKKYVIPLWQKIGGVAAVIAIMILAGSQWFISPEANNGFVDSPKNEALDNLNIQNAPANERFVNPDNRNSDFSPVVNSDNGDKSSSRTVASGNNAEDFISNNLNSKPTAGQSKNSNTSSQLAINTGEYTLGKSGFTSKNADLANYTALVSELNSKPLNLKNQIQLKANPISGQTDIIIRPKLKSLVEVAEQINNEKSIKRDIKEKSWFFKPQISPIVYGNLGSGSAVDQNFDQNQSQSEVNMSYGLNIAYKLNDKLKIRTGINRVSLNYNTNDVFVLPNSGFSSFSNVDIASSFESSVVTSDQLSVIQESQVQGRIAIEESQLQQQLGFIEIPMELEYKLLDKKIDINIIGGASTLLLNDNSLDVETATSTVFLGEANNVNNLSFTTNFAIGLDYDISDKLILNLEPTFKYQINTFQSGTTEFQPFFIGVYSGVVFKF